MSGRPDDGRSFWERWRSRSRLGRALEVVLALGLASQTLRAVIARDWNDAVFSGMLLAVVLLAFVADARQRRS